MVARSISAGRRQRVARLKLAHGLGHGLVVLAGDALPDEVAADLKTPMKDLDGLAGRAGTHGIGRHSRPAAIRHDGLVMLDRGLGRFDIARRQRRRAERRIGDPLTRRGGAFLGRKLVAMKGAGARRLGRGLEHPAAAACRRTVRRDFAAAPSRSLALISSATKPGEKAGIGGLARRNEKTGRQGEASRRARPPSRIVTMSPCAAPVSRGFAPLSGYWRFAPCYSTHLRASKVLTHQILRQVTRKLQHATERVAVKTKGSGR